MTQPRRILTSSLLCGLLATAALTGLLLLFSQITRLSFVPLDIADAIIRLTPGTIATTAIEQLGPGAKLSIELAGSFLFIAVGGLLAALYSRFAPRPVALVGVLLTAVTLALTLAVQAITGGVRGGVVGLGLTTLLYLAWGCGLATLVNRLTQPALAATPSPERRVFMLRSGGTLLAVALGSTALAQLLERGGSAGPAVAGAGQSLPTIQPTVQPTVQPTTKPAAVQATAPADAAAGAAAPSAAPTIEPTAAPTPPPAFVPAPGTRSPLNTNESLYVISSSTRDPELSKDTWRLSIEGAVDNPFSLSYDELLMLPPVAQNSTLECISNEVGNYLIGTCAWSGVPLRDLLARAGIQEGVIDIKLTAADGYTESIPLAKALEPTTLVAYGIGGEALGVNHGFPARLRVPGLYGVKNVKWITTIEPVREDYQGYWQQRGWTDSAVIETTSVFDTGNPRLSNAPLKIENGVVPLGGIAFAGNRGIASVEVKIDDGAWQQVELDPLDDPLTWRFWRYDWAASPGQHMLSIRATDATGALQTDAVREPHPDGATGYHMFSVEVA